MAQFNVAAPDGYQGSVSYCDATRAWRVFAKPVGATWWTTCGVVSHADAPRETVVAAAEAVILERVQLGMVK